MSDKENLDPKKEELPQNEQNSEVNEVNEEVQTDTEKEVTLPADDKTDTPAFVTEDKKEEPENSIEETENPDAPIVVPSDSAIVIDSTSEEPAPNFEPQRTVILKEPMSKKKRIKIACIAAVVVVVLFSAIFFPCFFYFKGKVMVSSAEDLLKGAEGKYFVLKKDIIIDKDLSLSSLNCSSIDLNGHNLTVKGTLKLSTNSSKQIDIGTKSGDKYIPKGLLSVGDLEIDAKAANLNLAATTVIKGALKANVKNFTSNGFSIVNASQITAETITINEAISVANNEIKCTFTSQKINIYGKINVEVSEFKTSNIVVNKTASLKNVILDDSSTMQIFGNVKSVLGGAKVALLDTATCNSFSRVKLLAIYNPHEKTFSTNACDKVISVYKHETPTDLIVEEKDSKFLAKCAIVNPKLNPVKYQFVYTSPNGNAKPSNPSVENTFDITSFLKAEAGGAASVKISVKVIGDFNFSTLDAASLNDGDTLFLDSDEKTISYVYSLVLSTPTGLNVEKVDDVVNLSFNPVEFADAYKITIDGKAITPKEGEVTTINITDYVKDLGYHAIRVSAISKSKEIIASKEAMISYKTTKQLNAPSEISAICKSSGDKYVTTISFTAPQNGKMYLISFNGNLYRLSNNTSLTIESEESLIGQTGIIISDGYEFYLDSVETTFSVEAE